MSGSSSRDGAIGGGKEELHSAPPYKKDWAGPTLFSAVVTEHASVAYWYDVDSLDRARPSQRSATGCWLA